MTEEKTNELFIRYKQTGDVAIRNQIAEKYLYIADILAKKFVGRGVEYDDLKQVASLALLRGIDRFDPSLGMQFSTFITPTIAGEIKNYFRDKSRIVKVPRRLSEIGSKVRAFCNDYQAKHGEQPKIRDISEGIGVSEELVVRALEVAGTVSLDGINATDEDGKQSLYGLIADPEDKYEEFETKETLRMAMQHLTETERKVVKYSFVDELSQSETAKRLGVSQMFVSRLERKVLAKLKENLEKAE
jgi:RNA polymerase sigma-B factor